MEPTYICEQSLLFLSSEEETEKKPKQTNQSSLEAIKKAAEWIDSEVLWLNGQATTILGYRIQEISGRNSKTILVRQPTALKQTEALTECWVLFWSAPF